MNWIFLWFLVFWNMVYFVLKPLPLLQKKPSFFFVQKVTQCSETNEKSIFWSFKIHKFVQFFFILWDAQCSETDFYPSLTILRFLVFEIWSFKILWIFWKKLSQKMRNVLKRSFIQIWQFCYFWFLRYGRFCTHHW